MERTRQRKIDREHLYQAPAFLEIQRRVGANIRKLRLEKELTQEQLAYLAGLSTRVFQRAEAGESNLTLVTISRLCTALSVRPEDLVR